MKMFYEASELVDPRPNYASRFSYRGMPLLPVSYDCDWMVSDKALRHAVKEQIFVIKYEE